MAVIAHFALVRRLLAPFSLCLISACAHGGAATIGSATQPAPSVTLAERYAMAVDDASHPLASELAHTLAPLSTQNARLVWQGPPGSSRVRVVTWTGWDGYDARVSREMELAREVWVTAVPEIQDRCRASGSTGPALSLVLEQLLGLPPESHKTRMVELWVSPSDVFRPCPDAEVDDTECELSFPTDVAAAHRAWIDALRASSYVRPGYPWTQLGYTYDWGDGAEARAHLGASEFVVRAGASVQVIGVTTTDEYCAPSSD